MLTAITFLAVSLVIGGSKSPAFGKSPRHPTKIEYALTTGQIGDIDGSMQQQKGLSQV